MQRLDRCATPDIKQGTAGLTNFQVIPSGNIGGANWYQITFTFGGTPNSEFLYQQLDISQLRYYKCDHNGYGTPDSYMSTSEIGVETKKK